MRHVRAIMLGVTLLALVVACSGYMLLREVRASASTSNEAVEVEIEPGDSTGDIATKLRAAGLIRQPLLFTALVRYRGLEGQLQSGRYLLTPSMTMSEIMVALQYSRVDEVEVTIPEGLRIEEIADIIAETELMTADEFLEVARDGARFKETHFYLSSLPDDASLEGYLFPDTYRLATTATPEEVIEVMLTNFDEKYASIERDVRVPDVSIHDIVTMAAVVQRESALIEEMPRIAAVFWNRLKPENTDETGGGRLQADATVQYALGYNETEQTWWRKELSAADLTIDNPYNTRERRGLPPGPICNPGLDALRAAAQPDESNNYLYFVADCARDGSHNFATTFAEFQELEAQFLACSN